MNLLSFYKRFPDEASCRIYLKNKREEQGIVCKKCGCEKHYWLTNVGKWRCADCKTCINLKAGTIMEKSKLPLQYWFITIHLMTSTKKSFSALELQKQLGHSRYEPIWYMMQKIRSAMGKRDRQYQLKGEIEMDDAFFEIVDTIERDELGNPKHDKGDKKRGRGSQKQVTVLVMVESKFNPEQRDRHKKKRAMGFVKMKVVDDMSHEGIHYEVRKAVDSDSVVLTDGYSSYSRLGSVVKEHKRMIVPGKEAMNKLPWVHTVISNAKRLFLGVHHSVNKGYLQNYLDEFCYKLNRRNFESDLFDRMLLAGSKDTWY